MMSKQFNEAVANRRTYYQISKTSPISDTSIQSVVEHAVTHAPSPFNSQSGRVVLLLKAQHDKLWDLTREALRKIVPAESFAATDEKIQSFQNGYGSVLYFDDHAVVEGLQDQFPTYKDNFPLWAQQASGMLQLVIWVALENEGFGASLQHYNELIEADVKQQWGLPSHWKLIAQMPFGTPTATPSEKVFLPLDERMKVF